MGVEPKKLSCPSDLQPPELLPLRIVKPTNAVFQGCLTVLMPSVTELLLMTEAPAFLTL
jgi:hypothetical protein